MTAVRRPVVQERAERAILVVLDRGRERALREHVAARRANVAPEVELVAHRVFPALRATPRGVRRVDAHPRPPVRPPATATEFVSSSRSWTQKPWNTSKKSFVVGRINGEQQRNVRPSAHTARRDGRVPDPPIFPRVTRRSRRANATKPGPSFDLRPGVRSLDHADSRLPDPDPVAMSGRWQDTIAKLELESSMSNKERFEKLKESRQKYKDEAKAAKERCELLEQQLKMLVAQLESEDASAAAAGAGADTSAAAENESLKAQLEKARQECARLQKVVIQRNQAIHAATTETSEWREKAGRAAKASASASSTGAATTTTDAAAYAYGALLGAGLVAGIGYVALTYGVKR